MAPLYFKWFLGGSRNRFYFLLCVYQYFLIFNECFVIRGKHSHHCNSLVVRVRNSYKEKIILFKEKNAINWHLWLKIWQWILFQAWLQVHMRSWGSCSIPFLSLLGVHWSTGKVRIRGCVHGSKWPELLHNAEEGEPSKGLWEEEAVELGLE